MAQSNDSEDFSSFVSLRLVLYSIVLLQKVTPQDLHSLQHYSDTGSVMLVLEPMLTNGTDPDKINQSLLSYLLYQETMSSSYRRAFSYAPSFEDFVELIAGCQDIAELKQIRYWHVIG